MKLEDLLPYIRFVKSFSYFPRDTHYVTGYDYRLFYIIEGNSLLKFKENEVLLEKHSIALIPPGTSYRLSVNDEKSIEILCFNFDTVKGEGRPEASVHPCESESFDNNAVFEKQLIPEFKEPMIIKNSGQIRDRLFEINREYISRETGYIQRASGIFGAVLVDILRAEKKHVRKEARLCAQVRDYLYENMGKKIDAETLSEHFHYHPNYINRVFKDDTGTTIHSYLIEIRIEAAKQMLATSNLSLEKIAFKCGFKALPHFSQCFKLHCGVSPSEYRINTESYTI